MTESADGCGPKGRKEHSPGLSEALPWVYAQANPHNRPEWAEGMPSKPMPQSLAKLYVHLVFSTKRRHPFLTDDARPDLHAYLGGILRDLDCPAIEINSVADHVHLLLVLARTTTLGDVVANLKRGSSVWIRSRGASFTEFHWQAGYGAFSVSQSSVNAVRACIRDQPEHHRRLSFQDEYRAFLRKHGITFDEQYVWD
jgi:REP element-mobilizing transposase RayT